MKLAVAGATGLLGRLVVELAKSEGHDVVELSRSGGFDLTDDAVQPRLQEALTGADAVIDVTQGTSFDEEEASEFFRRVATNLGEAAHAAGVSRTVVLSIVGIERSPDYGYYVAKIAQEEAHRAASPGVVVLRATQFHEFAGQMIDWSTEDGVAEIMDVRIQPVESAVVARALVDLATGAEQGDLQLAGPEVENLVALAREEAARRRDVEVKAGEGPASMVAGAMLPRPEDGVVVRGRTWHEWATSR